MSGIGVGITAATADRWTDDDSGTIGMAAMTGRSTDASGGGNGTAGPGSRASCRWTDAGRTSEVTTDGGDATGAAATDRSTDSGATRSGS